MSIFIVLPQIFWGVAAFTPTRAPEITTTLHEVAVIGVPHPKRVETPIAVVVTTNPGQPPSDHDIIRHAADHLASLKKPSAVWFVPHLPRNASGKVLKGELREFFAALRREATVR